MGLDSPWALLRGVTWTAGVGGWYSRPSPARWGEGLSPSGLEGGRDSAPAPLADGDGGNHWLWCWGCRHGHAAVQRREESAEAGMIWQCRLRASRAEGGGGLRVWSSPAVVRLRAVLRRARPSGLWRGQVPSRKTRASLPSPLPGSVLTNPYSPETQTRCRRRDAGLSLLHLTMTRLAGLRQLVVGALSHFSRGVAWPGPGQPDEAEPRGCSQAQPLRAWRSLGPRGEVTLLGGSSSRSM